MDHWNEDGTLYPYPTCASTATDVLLTPQLCTNMAEEEKEDGAENRSIDIEDQGQEIDAGEEIDPDVESVKGDENDPGPEGEGAREATQKSGEAPTEIVDEEDDPEDGQ